MAHVEKRGKRWRAVYRNPAAVSGRGVRTFDRKIDAERFLTVTQAAQLRREWVDPRAGRVTVADYCAAWLAVRNIRETTRCRYVAYFAHLDTIADVPIGDLTPSTLEAWQSGLLSRMAASTAGTIRGVLASVLLSAVRDRVIASTPMDGVRAPKPERVLVHPLPADVVFSIHDLITPRYRAAVLVGAGAGLRLGETLGLTVDRVDFLRRFVTVDRQLVQVGSAAPEFGPPKTRASVRKIPVGSVLVDALAAHLAEYPAIDGRVFSSSTGQRVRRAHFWEAWKDAEVRRWALATGQPLLGGWRIPADVAEAYLDDTHEHTRFHDLRHFYASTLIEDGRSVKEVQARLGHATAAETLDTYAHLWPSNDDGTRGSIDRALTRTSDAAGPTYESGHK